MNREQITQALEAIQKILKIVAEDEGWRAIHEADHTGEQETNLNDAIHYLEEILCNL